MSRTVVLQADVVIANAGGDIFAPGAVRYVPSEGADPSRILAVGPRDQIASEPGDEVRDLGPLWLMPGLVQAHVHFNQTLYRSLAERRRLLAWLRERIWPLEAAHDEASVYAASRFAIREMLLHGATSALSMETTRHSAGAFRAAHELGFRAVIGTALMDREGPDVPDSLTRNGSEALAETVELDRAWSARTGGRLRANAAPRFVLSCTEELLRESARVAHREGLVWHTHVSENRQELEEVRTITGMDNADYFDHIGALGANSALAHGVWLTDGEIEMLGGHGASVLHCPSTNLKLGSGVARTFPMHRAGVKVALGSDGAPCNNRLDILQEMRLAGLLASWSHGTEDVDPAVVFGWATEGGAAAMDQQHRIGRLAEGYEADLLALRPTTFSGEVENPEDVYTHLVFGSAARDVDSVWVAGRQLVDGGRLTVADERDIAAGYRVQREAAVKRAGL